MVTYLHFVDSKLIQPNKDETQNSANEALYSLNACSYISVCAKFHALKLVSLVAENLDIYWSKYAHRSRAWVQLVPLNLRAVYTTIQVRSGKAVKEVMYISSWLGS